MPMRSEPEPETQLCLDALLAAGAVVLDSTAITDLAKHRCVVAGKVYRTLDRLPHVEVVTWLDSDQVVSVLAVAVLSALAAKLDRAVSGAYVVRQSTLTNPPIAASAIDLPPELVRYSDMPGWVDLYLPQVYCGMGCLAVPRRVFAEHCERSVQVDQTYSGGSVRFPAVCWSGPVPRGDGTYDWATEDYAYCELQAAITGRLPVLAPVSVGHVRPATANHRREILWPTVESLLTSDPPELAWGPEGKRCAAPPALVHRERFGLAGNGKAN